MKKILLSALMVMAAISIQAQDFFSTDKADEPFTFGARVGFNTSNRTVNSSMVSVWNINAWGTGFDIGAVANINIRNYLTIQPGFFFESRSGSFVYQNKVKDIEDHKEVYNTQRGKGRDYLFTIPVMGIIHFNILEDLRWNVEFGPYVQLKLKSTFDRKFSYPELLPDGAIYYNESVKTSKCDFGFKMGTSLDICNNYYVGVHYLAGMLRAWNPAILGGHNKEWMFTVGYNF